jgi:hypothetical protein
MSDDSERALLERVRQHLDAATRDLDGATLTRLRAARSEALRAAGEARRAPAWAWPVTGVLTAGVVAALAAALWIGLGSPRTPVPTAGIEDMELIATLDHVDLYTDADFYRWLAEQNNAV